MRSTLLPLVLVACGSQPQEPADPQRAADSAMIVQMGGSFSDSAWRRADSAAKVAEVKSLVRNGMTAMQGLRTTTGSYPDPFPREFIDVLPNDSVQVEIDGEEYTLTVIRPGVARCAMDTRALEMSCESLP